MTASQWRWRLIPLIGVLLVVGVASVAYAVGTASRGAPAAPAAQAMTIPGHPELGPGWSAPGNLTSTTGGGVITIAKIDGSRLSLQTTDGWTRTIDAAGATITKSGKTIALTDLKVGDRISFREARQSDGTYKISTIQVLSPSASGVTTAPSFVQGTVTSKTATTIVVTTTAGKTVTVNVSAATRYSVRGVSAPTLANVAVGGRIVAGGTLNADGSLTATVVQVPSNNMPGFGGSGGRSAGGGRGRVGPQRSPAPSASAAASGSTT